MEGDDEDKCYSLFETNECYNSCPDYSIPNSTIIPFQCHIENCEVYSYTFIHIFILLYLYVWIYTFV
jgi:hypothetical protein